MQFWLFLVVPVSLPGRFSIRFVLSPKRHPVFRRASKVPGAVRTSQNIRFPGRPPNQAKYKNRAERWRGFAGPRHLRGIQVGLQIRLHRSLPKSGARRKADLRSLGGIRKFQSKNTGQIAIGYVALFCCRPDCIQASSIILL
jgi:hypothetical protein